MIIEAAGLEGAASQDKYKSKTTAKIGFIGQNICEQLKKNVKEYEDEIFYIFN